MSDKFTAVWVSHSSISDFLKCPRAYFLNNVYKDPQSGHKISLTTPAMSLGSAVHEVLESLSILPTQVRFKESLIKKLDQIWQKYAGKKGGFVSLDQEQEYKLRAEVMLKIVMDQPGPLENLAVKIKQDLPHYWLSEEENIILCGKIDWLEYFQDDDTVGILDFKTGKNQEDEQSLQLPIYALLVANCQSREAVQARYWYLANNKFTEQKLPELSAAHNQILEIAKKIKLARKLEQFKCPSGDKGCFACRPFEAIISGDAEFVGTNSFNQDLYLVDSDSFKDSQPDSVIL